jgi:hypothetical protein
MVRASAVSALLAIGTAVWTAAHAADQGDQRVQGEQASPAGANAHDSPPSFSRLSGNAYGTVLDSCGVTQIAVTISALATPSPDNAPTATASVVFYRFDSCKGSSVFASGSSRRDDLSVEVANGGHWPETVTVSGQIPLHVFTTTGNRDPATFRLTLHRVNPLSWQSGEDLIRATSNGLYEYNDGATGALTLPEFELRSFPLPNGQMKIERYEDTH